MNDFKAEPPELRAASQLAVGRVLESGWYVLGNELTIFERLWAETCGTNQGVGVGNGMDAIEISLRCLGIGPGDEVITTSMTAFATVLAILRAGATPVLADIEPDTAMLSLDSVKRCISRSTKALVLVHLYGQVRDMDAWCKFCTDSGIALVEDCAQSHLASWRGRVAGSFGRVGAYSFYPTKNLGAIGDGGMIVTSDIEIASRARCLRNYGQTTRYHHAELGLNSRLDELQAAVLGVRLRWLPSFTKRRQKFAEAYRFGISNPLVVQMAAPQESNAHVYHLYVVLCKQRDALKAHLEKCGIQSLIHYPIPVHRQEPCWSISRDTKGLAACEAHAENCLSLPCHPQLTDVDVAKVIEAVNAFRSV